MEFLHYIARTVYIIFILASIHSLPIITIQAGNSTFSYGELLNEADKNNKNLRFQFALDKIRLAGEMNDNPGFHFYRVYGDSLLGLGRGVEALQYYRKSILLQPEQPELLIQMSGLYRDFNQPEEELAFLQKYLEQVPFNRELLYRVMVLAGRTEKTATFESTLQTLNSQNQYKDDYETILQKIRDKIRLKQFKQALEDCDRFIPHFPDSIALHELKIRTLLISKGNPRNAYLEAAALDNSARSTLRYGIYLFQKMEYHEALAVTRRAFLMDLARNGADLNREILYYLRQIYHKMGKDYDAGAATDMSSENLKIILDAGKPAYQKKLTSFPDNREYLVLFIYAFKTRGDKKNQELFIERLKKREYDMQWDEMLYGSHSFRTSRLLNAIILD